LETETIYELERIHVNVLVKATGNFLRYVLRRWYLVVLAILVGSVAGWWISKWYGTRYTAASAYTIQAQSNTGLLNTALSLASSLGLGASKSGPTTYDNNFFAGLMKSRRIVKDALLDSANVNDKNDLLANHFIVLSKTAKDWDNDTKNFNFQHADIQRLTTKEDSVLSLFYEEVIDDNLAVVYDPAAPFNKASVTTKSREFSVELMNKLLDQISNYYTNTLLQYNLNNLGLTEQRSDSLARALKAADARVARLRDNAQNVVRQEAMIALNDAIREQSLLSTQYAAAVSNYETAKAAVLSTSPILQVIDEPAYSVDSESLDALLAAIVGAVLACVAVVALLAVARYVRTV
jgi:hypothetical protein